MTEVPLPHLWALTPTLPSGLVEGFRALPREGFPPGCFGLAEAQGDANPSEADRELIMNAERLVAQ